MEKGPTPETTPLEAEADQREDFIEDMLDTLERGPIAECDDAKLQTTDRLLYEHDDTPNMEPEHMLQASMEIVHNLAAGLKGETGDRPSVARTVADHLDRAKDSAGWLRPIHFVALADAGASAIQDKVGEEVQLLRRLENGNIAKAVDRVLYLILADNEISSVPNYAMERYLYGAVIARRLAEKAVGDPGLTMRRIDMSDVLIRFNTLRPERVKQLAAQNNTVSQEEVPAHLYRSLRPYPSTYPYFKL